jgi:hypothetical protein
LKMCFRLVPDPLRHFITLNESVHAEECSIQTTLVLNTWHSVAKSGRYILSPLTFSSDLVRDSSNVEFPSVLILEPSPRFLQFRFKELLLAMAVPGSRLRDFADSCLDATVACLHAHRVLRI